MTTYVQDPITLKLVEKSKYLAGNHSAAVHVMEPFISPIDQSVITDGASLRAHNRKHGVTDQRDYGPDWFARKGRERDLRLQGQDKASKQDRLNALKQATRHIRT